jgi:hypothetical protein
MCDQHKADYANQLCQANCIKTKYYDEQLPASVNTLQTLEEKRIKQFKEFTDECVAVEMEVIPRIERCHKGMQVAVNEISAENDIECVVNALKTGYAKPANHVFEDLSNPSQKSSTPTNTSNISLNEQQSFDSTSSMRASKFKTISRLRGLLKPKVYTLATHPSAENILFSSEKSQKNHKHALVKSHFPFNTFFFSTLKHYNLKTRQ